VRHVAYLGVCGDHKDAAWKPGVQFRVARAMFEQDGIPKANANKCNNNFDEIWVPTKFNADAFAKSGVDRAKIRVVGEAVDTTEFSPGDKPKLLERYGVKPTDFVFLSVFKWEDRKNWQALLRVFYQEFENDPNVRLVIKTSRYMRATPNRAARQYLSTLDKTKGPALLDTNRTIIFEEWEPSDTMPLWFRASNAFVLPTHGEGWGLPIAEAMATALPVLATDWGGTTEFMNDKNALPIKVGKLVRTREGFQWAEVDETDMRQKMRWAIDHREEATKLGAQARSDMHTKYSLDAMALVMEEAFSDVARKLASRK